LRRRTRRKWLSPFSPAWPAPRHFDIVLYSVTYEWGIITPLIRAVMGQGLRYVSTGPIRKREVVVRRSSLTSFVP
jgi:hypothetical protein